VTIHDLSGLRALPLLLLLCGIAMPAGAGEPLQQVPPRTVRVQLFEQAGPTRVSGRLVAPARRGLRVDGQRLGSSIWIAGPGPHRTQTHLVRGEVEVHRTGRGLQVINRVPLEDYVAATVGGEIGGSWEDEVLKAQAVVARTYALYQQSRNRGESYDVSAGTRHQVYAGVEGETPRVRQAARATAGQVLVYEGEPILAAYHSSSGGRTAGSGEVWGTDLPYLASREVPGEQDSSSSDWRAVIAGPTLARALVPLGLRLGAIHEVQVAERSASGRARTLWIGGSRGGGSLSARVLRRALGASVIRSTLFEVREEGGSFIFAGSGHGHGVGMSQWGARAMARAGASYREILTAFYPGANLSTLGVQTTASAKASATRHPVPHLRSLP